MELKITGTERILNSIYAITESGFDDIMASLIKKLEAKIAVVHDNFFKQLVQSGIDVSKAPNLGIYTPNWKPLTSRKYQERRKRQYGVYYNRFYRNTGELKTSLSEMSASTTFGKPLVLFKRGSVATGDKLEVRYEKWKGQSKRRRVVRGPKGRIMSSNTRIPKSLKSQIVINVFPNVTEDVRNGLNLHKYFDKKTAFKLGNTGNSRPLMANYMNWYVNSKIRKLVKGVV